MNSRRSAGTHRLIRKLSAYAAGGVALAAAEANASIIYTDLGVNGVRILEESSFSVDLDADGRSEVTLLSGISQSTTEVCTSTFSTCHLERYTTLFLYAYVDRPGVGIADSGGFARRFQASDLIVEGSAAQVFMSSSFNATGVGIGYGPFSRNRGFLGVQFQDVAGEVHVAWMDVEGRSMSEPPTIYGYAFETVPGRSIAAGAVPEPPSLLLLAAGAAGLAMLRRRRGRPEIA